MDNSANLLVYQTLQVHPSPANVRECEIILSLKFILIVYLNLRIVKLRIATPWDAKLPRMN